MFIHIDRQADITKTTELVAFDQEYINLMGSATHLSGSSTLLIKDKSDICLYVCVLCNVHIEDNSS